MKLALPILWTALQSIAHSPTPHSVIQRDLAVISFGHSGTRLTLEHLECLLPEYCNQHPSCSGDRKAGWKPLHSPKYTAALLRKCAHGLLVGPKILRDEFRCSGRTLDFKNSPITQCLLKQLPNAVNYTHCLPQIEMPPRFRVFLVLRNPVDAILSMKLPKQLWKTEALTVVARFALYRRLLPSSHLSILHYERGHSEKAVRNAFIKLSGANLLQVAQNASFTCQTRHGGSLRTTSEITHRNKTLSFAASQDVKQLVSYTWEVLPAEEDLKQELLSVWEGFIDPTTQNGLSDQPTSKRSQSGS